MTHDNVSANISTVILFGSNARNDADAYSDIDICVIVKDKQTSDNSIKSIPFLFNVVLHELAIYSEQEFCKMLKYGSLFVWHLKLEGHLLYDDGFYSKHIDALVDYNHHLEELNYHSDILKDIRQDYDIYNMVNELDLSILFTICRNTCMILCHFRGAYVFGRKNVFAKANNFYINTPLDHNIYSELALWKLHYERGLNAKQQLPSPSEFNGYINKVTDLIEYAYSQI